MPATVLVGTAWGDEGKGKIVDFISETYDLVVRFNGGANAGHTIVLNDEIFKLHLLPSGVIQGKEIMIGNGVVIDPDSLKEEIKSLEDKGYNINLTISDRAHVVTEKHKTDDAKDTKIGTTKRGIGPCYSDKATRQGVLACDLEGDETIKKYLGDVSLKVNNALDNKKSVLLECAQGTMLDIDFGSYPYVTSSNTIAGSACTGTGIPPSRIDKVIGIVKAYTTRVGEGPFPTELSDENGKHLQEVGKEFGATTGRARRCGWLDLMVSKYAVRLSGITEIALTKLDVLCGLDKLKVCTAYTYKGKTLKEFPSNPRIFEHCEPVYEELPGFGDVTQKQLAEAIQSGYMSFPSPVKNYIEKIEDVCKTNVKLVSFGPNRIDTLIKG